jgi:NADH:ubiquinone oxidoreductase subunit 3 (subunit A)
LILNQKEKILLKIKKLKFLFIIFKFSFLLILLNFKKNNQLNSNINKIKTIESGFISYKNSLKRNNLKYLYFIILFVLFDLEIIFVIFIIIKNKINKKYLKLFIKKIILTLKIE